MHGKTEEIVEMMKRRNLDILGVSETREKISRKETLHGNYTFIGSGMISGKYGVGIIVRDGLAQCISKYDQVNGRILRITLKTKTQKLTIIQVYAPQQGRPKEEKEAFYNALQDVRDKCGTDENVIIMGDLNGHVGIAREGYESCLGHFGIGDRNEEGLMILDFCNRNDLKIMNTYYQHQDSHKYSWYGWNGNTQRYERKTLIDFFLVKNHRIVLDVKCLPSESLDADHRLVVMKTKTTPLTTRPITKVKRVNVNAMQEGNNRLRFLSSINTALEKQGDEFGTVEEEWNGMMDCVYKAVDETIGYKYSSKSKKRKTPWWTEEVRTAVKTKTKTFRKWMRTRNPENRRRYELARNNCESIKKSAKDKTWEKLCEDLESDLSGNKKLIYHLAKSYRKGNTEKIYNIKDPNTDEILTIPSDIDNVWSSYFKSLLNPVEVEGNITQMGEIIVDESDTITEEEVEQVVKSSKNGKATGTDMISNDLYKLGAPITTRWLTRVLQVAYNTGRVPPEWGKAIICPIYKHKGDILRCENYRGISLLNHVTKLYETILEKRVRYIVEEKLGPWQHGFRSGRSTVDMVFTLRRIMDKHWEYNKPLYIAFLDLEKAFDRVPRTKLWESLDHYNLPGHLKRAIISLYENTQNRVATGNDAETWFETNAGVRQGSVLSPLLFIMYLDLVIKEVAVDQRTTDILAYADDIAQLADTEEMLQRRLLIWDKTFEKYGLKLNYKKTELVVLCRSNVQVSITLKNQVIKQTSTFQYLGSTISENGLIDIEINKRITKYSQNVGLMYRLLKDKNVPKKVKRIVYLGILRPILLYGHETWNVNTRNMSRLTAAEMRVIRMINGVTLWDRQRNTDLCERTNIIPIREVITSSQIRYFGHIKRRESSHPTQLALNYTVSGTRPTGRPRKRWFQYVDDYLKERGTNLATVDTNKDYMDRERWRKIVAFHPDKT
jgi:exonuclease III